MQFNPPQPTCRQCAAPTRRCFFQAPTTLHGSPPETPTGAAPPLSQLSPFPQLSKLSQLSQIPHLSHLSQLSQVAHLSQLAQLAPLSQMSLSPSLLRDTGGRDTEGRDTGGRYTGGSGLGSAWSAQAQPRAQQQQVQAQQAQAQVQQPPAQQAHADYPAHPAWTALRRALSQSSVFMAQLEEQLSRVLDDDDEQRLWTNSTAVPPVPVTPNVSPAGSTSDLDAFRAGACGGACGGGYGGACGGAGNGTCAGIYGGGYAGGAAAGGGGQQPDGGGPWQPWADARSEIALQLSRDFADEEESSTPAPEPGPSLRYLSKIGQIGLLAAPGHAQPGRHAVSLAFAY